jgi:hypothetical protein
MIQQQQQVDSSLNKGSLPRESNANAEVYFVLFHTYKV